MIDVTVEAESDETTTVLSRRATHPDTWAFPFPHHRIARARVLWSGDRRREWLVDQPASADRLAGGTIIPG